MLGASASPRGKSSQPRTAESELETDISGNGSTYVDGEPEIAVNPTNPKNLLIDWTRFLYNPFYNPFNPASADAVVSDNGGLSWHPVNLGLPVGPFGNGGDAVAAAGPDGTLYAGNGVATAVSTGGPAGGFTVHGKDQVTRSTDEGETWSAPVETMGSDNARFAPGTNPQDPFDRPWLAVDQSSNTVYASGANVGNHERFVTASTDEAQSFGPIYPVDSPTYPGIGGTIAAVKRVLAVAYTASKAPGASCPCVIFETSTDYGATFTRHVVPLVNASSSPDPFLAADPVGTGRFALTVFDASGTQVQVYETDDFGNTWHESTLVGEVGETPATQLFKPWISYGPSGQLAVMWRTLDSNNSYDIWAAVSRGEGHGPADVGPPLRVSSVAAPYPSHCSLGGLFGPTTCFGDDFSWIILDHKYAHVGWGDSRNVPFDGGVQTWYARIPLAAFN
jgi:hypothetical protein